MVFERDEKRIINKLGDKKEEHTEKSEEYDKDPQKKVKKSIDRSAALYLVADFLHNVIDGIGIGVAFNISKGKSLNHY